MFIAGSLFNQQTATISETNHNAGIVQSRVKKNVIVTTKGTYRLIGPPSLSKNKINNIFYEFWMVSGGFPKRFYELA